MSLVLAANSEVRQLVTAGPHCFVVSYRYFAPGERNLVRVSDMAYIPTRQGWGFPAGIKNLQSGESDGFSLARRMDTNLVLDAALAKAMAFQL